MLSSDSAPLNRVEEEVRTTRVSIKVSQSDEASHDGMDQGGARRPFKGKSGYKLAGKKCKEAYKEHNSLLYKCLGASLSTGARICVLH